MNLDKHTVTDTHTHTNTHTHTHVLTPLDVAGKHTVNFECIS